MINILKFIILGFIQGITEPIPVSSSGHLLIIKSLISKATEGIDFELLATITNTGSFIAIQERFFHPNLSAIPVVFIRAF